MTGYNDDGVRIRMYERYERDDIIIVARFFNSCNNYKGEFSSARDKNDDDFSIGCGLGSGTSSYLVAQTHTERVREELFSLVLKEEMT